MIVDDFDVVSVSFGKPEAEPPLIVDPNAVPTAALASQRLEPIPWWHPKESERRGSIQLREFTPGDSFHARETAHPVIIGESFGILTTVASNHLSPDMAFRWVIVKSSEWASR